MKFFVVADVHSFYNEMMKALQDMKFDRDNSDHVFVSLGDLMDRGPDSLKCLEFVNSLKRKILIRGNHEDLIQDCIKRKQFLSHDYHNGTTETIFQLVENIEKDPFEQARNNKLLQNYLDTCIDYYETRDYIFVHGWIPCNYSPFKNKYLFNNNWRTGNWEKSRWICGFDAWHDGVVVKNKTILCGHWHTSYAHSKYHNDGSEWKYNYVDSDDPKFYTFVDNGIMGLDGCTACSGIVNCVVLNIEEE